MCICVESHKMLPLCVISVPRPAQGCSQRSSGCLRWMVLPAGSRRAGLGLSAAVLAGCVCPKPPRGVCWSPAWRVYLLQPCRCCSGLGACQAHLDTWQLLTKAAIQNLPLDGIPLSHQPSPATEKTAGKTPFDLNEMRIRPSETSFQFIS